MHLTTMDLLLALLLLLACQATVWLMLPFLQLLLRRLF